MTIDVPIDIVPCRLDVYLVQCGIGLSRNQIQKFIRSKNIEVVDKGTKPNFILHGGEVIEIEIPEDEPFRLLPENIPVDIIYEDDYLLVVNKPAGMVTHPARGNWTGTLLNAVLHHTNDISPIGGDFRPGIVHRLDKGTSGLLIIAKKASTHIMLSEILSKREIHRQYLALLWGHLQENNLIVDAPIGHHPKEPIKKWVVPAGRPAKTEFTAIAYFDFLELAKIKLFTGRTHQIRVHSAYIGHPVFGDSDYGGGNEKIGGIAPQYRNKAKELLKIVNRQMLHAYRLEFVHPETGKALVFEVAPPADFLNILDELNYKLMLIKDL
ncbi:RluA family pseudouridine synthase [bacterium]|nr:RluA family pseudouridine synthase [bacterium]